MEIHTQGTPYQTAYSGQYKYKNKPLPHSPTLLNLIFSITSKILSNLFFSAHQFRIFFRIFFEFLFTCRTAKKICFTVFFCFILCLFLKPFSAHHIFVLFLTHSPLRKIPSNPPFTKGEWGDLCDKSSNVFLNCRILTFFFLLRKYDLKKSSVCPLKKLQSDNALLFQV